MRTIAGLVIIATVMGCASPQGFKPTPLPSMLPGTTAMVDFPSRPVEMPEEAKSGTNFNTVPVGGGKLCPPMEGDLGKECQAVGAGFLISEQAYAGAVLSAMEVERLTALSTVVIRLRASELSAIEEGEKAYHKRIQNLESEVYRLRTPSLWDKAKPWVYFGAGVLVTTATGYGVSRASR
jgi:hypothetical protein